MERTMSVEDKIRRAEEIYYRRKNQEIPLREEIKKTEKKKNIKLFKKMVKQIVICLIIYSVSYLIINNNYIFSADFTQKVKEILSQDINLSQIYSTIINTINQDNQTIDTVEQQTEPQQNETVEQSTQQEITKEEIQSNDENIGGAEELPTTNELSQMEQDANYIKSTVSFIKPVNGVISSMFGLRNSTIASVSKNHTGTDIAAATGTKIISATDGKVITTSSKGNYGNHIKIQINDVIVIYAHCNKLYVKEGDIIKQGQEIAEVGSTGNSTGPHLHFEIRYQNRHVDPQLVVEL